MRDTEAQGMVVGMEVEEAHVEAADTEAVDTEATRKAASAS